MDDKTYSDRVDALHAEILIDHAMSLRANPVLKLALLNMEEKIGNAERVRDNPGCSEAMMRHCIGKIDGMKQFMRELETITFVVERMTADKKLAEELQRSKEKDPLLEYLSNQPGV